MQTQVRYHVLSGSLLVGLGVSWLIREPGALEAITTWGAWLGSRGSGMFMGLYSMAPTLHFRGTASPMTGQALCAAILGMAVLLMGTTIGGMTAYLLVRALVGVRWASHITRVFEAVSIGATWVRRAQ